MVGVDIDLGVAADILDDDSAVGTGVVEEIGDSGVGEGAGRGYRIVSVQPL